ncbi:hypothetical protein C8N44_105123 [Allosediminivita pacifica]|uniref:Uncharacterized protein n=1 Tax=Allosediminivita pacifica TaxID=1267769 RepID=A0A2T6B2K9_9RHOB|nr:hypothetical protein C8N44_105123 [Allosediminivita pacifica]
MGLIEKVLGMVFGGGRNVVAETAEVFRVNSEGQARRRRPRSRSLRRNSAWRAAGGSTG